MSEPRTKGENVPPDRQPEYEIGTWASDEERRAALEAVLFTSDRPLSRDELAQILAAAPQLVEQDLLVLARELRRARRGIRLRRVQEGYELVADPRWGFYLKRLHEQRDRVQLTRALLETLAVVAYHQPVTLAEISRMRGVDASHAVRQLLRLELVRVVGTKKAPGRPRLYGTTPRFLTLLGLESLDQLVPWENFLETIPEGHET